jgi:hypothetical protein
MIDYMHKVYKLEDRYKQYAEIRTLDQAIGKDYEIMFPAVAGEVPRSQKEGYITKAIWDEYKG